MADENRGCTTCVYRKDFLVPCDWLYEQTTFVLRCPHHTTQEELDNGKARSLFSAGRQER